MRRRLGPRTFMRLDFYAPRLLCARSTKKIFFQKNFFFQEKEFFSKKTCFLQNNVFLPPQIFFLSNDSLFSIKNLKQKLSNKKFYFDFN